MLCVPARPALAARRLIGRYQLHHITDASNTASVRGRCNRRRCSATFTGIRARPVSAGFGAITSRSRVGNHDAAVASTQNFFGSITPKQRQTTSTSKRAGRLLPGPVIRPIRRTTLFSNLSDLYAIQGQQAACLTTSTRYCWEAL